MSGSVACTSSRNSPPNPGPLASVPEDRLGQLARDFRCEPDRGHFRLRERRSSTCARVSVPGQAGKTGDGRLSAALDFGNPGLAIARLDVRLEACEKLRSHARALVLGELQQPP